MSIDTRSDSTRWEQAAETTWGRYLTEHEQRFLMRAIELAPVDGGAMEVGCEGGRWSRYIVESRGSVICTDIDAEVLAVCQRRLPEATCICTDPADEVLPAGDGELALLLVYEVYPVISASWFPGEAARVLRPGGVLLFSFHNPLSARGAAYLAASVVDSSRRSHGFYRGPTYGSFRRRLGAERIEVLDQEGLAWLPFPRSSDSRLVPAATRAERALGLQHLPRVSPWVLAIARKTTNA